LNAAERLGAYADARLEEEFFERIANKIEWAKRITWHAELVTRAINAVEADAGAFWQSTRDRHKRFMRILVNDFDSDVQRRHRPNFDTMDIADAQHKLHVYRDLVDADAMSFARHLDSHSHYDKLATTYFQIALGAAIAASSFGVGGLIGGETVAATMISGSVIGAGASASRQVLQLADGSRYHFSWTEVLVGGALGAVLGPIVRARPDVVMPLLSAVGLTSGAHELSEGNYITGTFDGLLSIGSYGSKDVRELVFGKGTYWGARRGLGPARTTVENIETMFPRRGVGLLENDILMLRADQVRTAQRSAGTGRLKEWPGAYGEQPPGVRVRVYEELLANPKTRGRVDAPVAVKMPDGRQTLLDHTRAMVQWSRLGHSRTRLVLRPSDGPLPSGRRGPRVAETWGEEVMARATRNFGETRQFGRSIRLRGAEMGELPRMPELPGEYLLPRDLVESWSQNYGHWR
jgi:hypothetical protein